jgi:hypothetical protein
MAPTGALVSRSPKSEYYTYLESSKIGGIIIAVILAVLGADSVISTILLKPNSFRDWIKLKRLWKEYGWTIAHV